MKIIKTRGAEGTYDFEIKQDDKIFKIFFGGNLDLYWSLTNLKNDDNYLEKSTESLCETFTITKENYYIYSLFEDLIEDIKNARVHEYESIEWFEGPDEETCQRWNEQLKNREIYKLPYDGENIIWHSDDEENSIADTVKIKKIEGAFLLEFIRPALPKDKNGDTMSKGISIRFSNFGSSYNPFNLIFMRMFHKLQEYDPDNHQIHIEELEYKKLIRANNQSKQYK